MGGQKMYCFSVYTKETGSSKPSHELEILQHQKSQNLGIFQCDYSAVFSDVSVEVGGGMMTTGNTRNRTRRSGSGMTKNEHTNSVGTFAKSATKADKVRVVSKLNNDVQYSELIGFPIELNMNKSAELEMPDSEDEAKADVKSLRFDSSSVVASLEALGIRRSATYDASYLEFYCLSQLQNFHVKYRVHITLGELALVDSAV